MVLKTLHLTNFQAHVNSKIEFNEGMNVFVGTNDANKSGVVRALGICLFNESFNVDYIHYGKKESIILLEFSDGRAVERVRTKSKNKLRFRDEKGNWSKDHSVSKIGEKLADFTGFKEVCLDGSTKTENLQLITTGNEHDLMFGCSPETVLKKLSTLFGTTEIEQVKIELSKELTSLNADKKSAESNLKTYQERFEYINSESVASVVESAYETIDNYESKINEANEKANKLENLLSLIKKVKFLYLKKKKLEELVDFTQNKLDSLLQDHKDNVDKLTNLEALEDSIHEVIENVEKMKVLQNTLTDLESQIQDEKCKQCGKLVKYLEC